MGSNVLSLRRPEVQASQNVIEVHPLISDEQRSFLAGDITAEQYLNLAQYEAELEAQRRAFESRTWNRTRTAALLWFSAAASLVYGLTAAVFLLFSHQEAALTAVVISVSFVGFTELLREVRRRIRPQDS